MRTRMRPKDEELSEEVVPEWEQLLLKLPTLPPEQSEDTDSTARNEAEALPPLRVFDFYKNRQLRLAKRKALLLPKKV